MEIHDEIVRHIIRDVDKVNDRREVLGVRAHVTRTPFAPVSILFRPVLHLPFQGRKRLAVGPTQIEYGAHDLVILAAHVPALVEVTEASDADPYVALEIPLDRALLAALVTQMPPQPATEVGPLFVETLPDTVLEPVLRLVGLAADPTAAQILAPGVRQEIFYRLLASPAGDALRGVLQIESTLARIDRVTEWMQTHLDVPVTVEDLAARAHMSVGSFHRQFREITGTSPVNYFKTVRLHEARRRVVSQTGTISQIASSVGFVSPSQFSRDYKRIFGVAPSRDAALFRTTTDTRAAWRSHSGDLIPGPAD